MIFFSIHFLSDQAAYIAIGLSYDNEMGQDSVIECVKENGAVKIYTSITRAAPGDYGSRRSNVVSEKSFERSSVSFKIVSTCF